MFKKKKRKKDKSRKKRYLQMRKRTGEKSTVISHSFVTIKSKNKTTTAFSDGMTDEAARVGALCEARLDRAFCLNPTLFLP